MAELITVPEPNPAHPAASIRPRTRATFWALAAFYGLVAFEFFYMASPFALYLYGAYLPGLRALTAIPGAEWLAAFFLPHYVTATSSALVRVHEALGTGLFVLGLVGFAAAAGQVYTAKLARKGAVLGGIYRLVRHPQYAALTVSGVGMLLLWPRFLVLVMFVTMLFAYVGLARLEERECAAKFGAPYVAYCRRTGGFVPRPLEWLRYPLLYVVSLLAALGVAASVRSSSVRALAAIPTERSVYVAVTDTEPDTLARIVALSQADPRLSADLDGALGTAPSRLINYVLPADWYVPEIPMNRPVGVDCHHTPTAHDRERYRVVFTRASLGSSPDAMGREILLVAKSTHPLLEATVDLRQGRVVEIARVTEVAYPGVATPIL